MTKNNKHKYTPNINIDADKEMESRFSKAQIPGLVLYAAGKAGMGLSLLGLYPLVVAALALPAFTVRAIGAGMLYAGQHPGSKDIQRASDKILEFQRNQMAEAGIENNDLYSPVGISIRQELEYKVGPHSRALAKQQTRQVNELLEEVFEKTYGDQKLKRSQKKEIKDSLLAKAAVEGYNDFGFNREVNNHEALECIVKGMSKMASGDLPVNKDIHSILANLDLNKSAMNLDSDVEYSKHKQMGLSL